MKLILFLVTLGFSFSSYAVTIEFPEDELARESVLPVFENALAVKSRRVPTAKRIELGLGMGFAMNEPFFDTSRFGGHLAYHFDETHGVLLNAAFYTQGLGSNGQGLAGTDFINDTDPDTSAFLRMERAPQPQYHFFANYQVTPYYGKISVFKDFVMNLSLYGLAGIGMVDIGGESVPALNLGIGQKFYFSKRWGIRADLNLMAYEGVNFFEGSGGGDSPIEDVDSDPGAGSNSSFVDTDKVPADFGRQMNYDLQLSIALIILI